MLSPRTALILLFAAGAAIVIALLTYAIERSVAASALAALLAFGPAVLGFDKVVNKDDPPTGQKPAGTSSQQNP